MYKIQTSNKKVRYCFLIPYLCRKEGIRTLDTVTRIPPFQGGLFNHSSTFLLILQMYKIIFNYKTSPLSNF